MMKLYYIRGNDVDGENQDLFVAAPDGQVATRIWNGYLVDEDVSWPRDGHDKDHDPTRIVRPRRIREILPDLAGTWLAGREAGPIAWDELAIAAEADDD